MSAVETSKPAKTRDRANANMKIVRDPIHGFIELPKELFDTIIDTPLFQRLRHIKQLGLLHYVYPGATHTRFEHSLGTAYLMQKLIEYAIRNTRNEVLPRVKNTDPLTWTELSQVLDCLEAIRGEAIVAALLHDIGHLMLSHTFEEAARDHIHIILKHKYKSISSFVKKLSYRKHEHITLELARILKDNNKRIVYDDSKGPVRLDIVYAILEQAYLDSKDKNSSLSSLRRVSNCNTSVLEKTIKLIAQLLSSSVDVDRADYIIRDSHYTGTEEGIYGLERLFAVAAIIPRRTGPSDSGERSYYLGVIDKGVTVVENMLLSRIYMYTDVYLHVVSIIYNGMATRLLSLVYQLPMHIKNTIAYKLPGARCIRDVLQRGITLSDKRLLQCVMKLTDNTFWALTSVLRKQHVIRGIADDLESTTGDKALAHTIAATLYLLAEGLYTRKHWSAYIIEGQKAAAIARARKTEEDWYIDTVINYMTPMIIVSTALYTAYTDKEEIRVYIRNQEISKELSKVSSSVIVNNIKNKEYAKAAIIFPPYTSPQQIGHWTLREGKHVEHALDKLERVLEKDIVLKAIKESAKNATRLARTLAEKTP